MDTMTKTEPASNGRIGMINNLRLDLSVVKNKQLQQNEATCVDGLSIFKRSSSSREPQTPMTPTRSNQLNLTFTELSYSVWDGLICRKRKKILSSISGDFRPGELTAIMGPSGSGKSSLMDILAGFTTSGVTGDIRVNERTRNLAAFRRSSAYIMQDDNLQPLLTVQEAMNIAANLKLESSATDKQESIDIILKEMSLETARTTCTGRLSGGQKKRLAVALELISNPPIMFFDEPTSGLDSVTSRQCISLLKSLAREGRTIVCTIHQPSATLFDMIDHLYVIADGHCAYAGGTRNLIVFLKSLGLLCPTYHNPADFLLETISGDYGEHLPRLIKGAENGRSKIWRKSRDQVKSDMSLRQLTGSNLELVLPKLPLSATPIFYEIDSNGAAYYATDCLTQLRILLWRNALRLSRDTVLTFIRIAMHILIALLVGTMFFQIGQDAAFARDNFSLLFFSLMFLMFSAFNGTLITFPAEVPILTREHFNRWYKLRSFYIANKLADLPVQVAATTAYTIIIYFMSGQIPEFDRLGLFVVMCLLVSLVAQMVGLILGAAMKVKNGVIFGPFVILPFMIFSGFFVQFKDAHPYLQWLFHVSFLKYGFEGVMVAVYGFDRPKMDCSEDFCYYKYPKLFLEKVDMEHADYWFSMLVLVVLYIFLDLTAYITLRIQLKRRKFR